MGTEDQRTEGTEDQRNSGYRGPVEQWIQRTEMFCERVAVQQLLINLRRPPGDHPRSTIVFIIYQRSSKLFIKL